MNHVDAERLGDEHDAANSDDDDAELEQGVTEEEVLQAFLTQSCFGVLMGLRQSWEQRPAAEKAAAPVMSGHHFHTAATAFLGLYLNDCYMHLLHEDDDYLLEVFALLAHDSPYCVLAYLFELGSCVFQRLNPESVLAMAEGDADGGADVNENRIHSIISTAAAEVISESFQNEDDDGDEARTPSYHKTLAHECDQPDLFTLRTDWVAEGRPNVQLFRVV